MKKSHEEKAYSHIISLHPSNLSLHTSALSLHPSYLFLGTNTNEQNSQIPSNTDLSFPPFISSII